MTTLAAPRLSALASTAVSPDGKILRSDVTKAKNYLTRNELDDLGSLANAFLDLDDRQILEGAGRFSKAQAGEYALNDFEKLRIIQDRHYIDDFDRLEEQAQDQQSDKIPNSS